MNIRYKDGKVEKCCTDIKAAKKKYEAFVAEKLHAAIEFIKQSDSLSDIACMPIYHFERMQGYKNGEYSISIGKNCGYRLIVIPLDENGNSYRSNTDIINICKQIKVILVTEVSNHYE